MQTTKPHKLLVLDAMRGVAACAVVLFHRSGKFPFPHAYLAVDFFFMLSGFVLAFAYQAKLDAGWSTKDFLATRIARLYPLYFLGLVCAFLVAFSGPAKFRPAHDWQTGLINLALLPSLLSKYLGTPYAFPYNIPSWSLFFEILANILHALFLRRRSKGFLGTISIVSAILLCWCAHGGPVNFGADNAELLGGFVRVVFSYITGMLLYRIWKEHPKKISSSAPVLVVILLLLFAGIGASKIGAAFDLIAVIGIFPVIIFFGAQAKLSHSMAGIARELGATSYGVYILHHAAVRFLTLRGWLSPFGTGKVIQFATTLAFVACIFVAASILDRIYDAPARAFLKRRLTAAG